MLSEQPSADTTKPPPLLFTSGSTQFKGSVQRADGQLVADQRITTDNVGLTAAMRAGPTRGPGPRSGVRHSTDPSKTIIEQIQSITLSPGGKDNEVGTLGLADVTMDKPVVVRNWRGPSPK